MRLGRHLGLALGSTAALATIATLAAPGAYAAPDASGQQWDMIDIRTAEAHTVATGAGATVAVIDTGVDVDHPEFAGRIVDPVSWICPEGVPVPCTGAEYADDGHGHGTHVAGTVAAADDGAGITGVAPDALIMPVRVGDDAGTISGDLVAAVRYAVDADVDVITMSIGTILGLGLVLSNPLVDDTFNAAVREAEAAGILVTLSAGNDSVPWCGQGELYQDSALCVGAYGPPTDPALYSDWGLAIDVIAPGGGMLTCEGAILSTAPLGTPADCAGIAGYQTMSGTSMAAPHVAGVGALLAEQGVTGEAAAQRIIDTARRGLPLPITLPGSLDGPRIDAAAAVGL